MDAIDVKEIAKRISKLENDIHEGKNVKEAEREIEYILASLPPVYLFEVVAELDDYLLN